MTKADGSGTDCYVPRRRSVIIFQPICESNCPSQSKMEVPALLLCLASVRVLRRPEILHRNTKHPLGGDSEAF
jgi:hypothetical protein